MTHNLAKSKSHYSVIIMTIIIGYQGLTNRSPRKWKLSHFLLAFTYINIVPYTHILFSMPGAVNLRKKKKKHANSSLYELCDIFKSSEAIRPLTLC